MTYRQLRRGSGRAAQKSPLTKKKKKLIAGHIQDTTLLAYAQSGLYCIHFHESLRKLIIHASQNVEAI